MGGPRPGGMRDGRILRFAEADTAVARVYLLCAFNTAEPARGWPYSIAPRIPAGLAMGNRYWAVRDVQRADGSRQ